MRKFAIHYIAGVGAVFAALSAARADAAEIRFKPQARSSAAVVVLADVADVFAADEFQADQLRTIELGPSPPTGGRRYLRAREVQDALLLRGINLAHHQFSGVDRVEIAGPGEPATAERPTFQATAAQRERAEQAVAAAIVQCLRTQAGERSPCEARVQLSESAVATVLTYGARLECVGGAPPFTGRQRFTFAARDASPPVRLEIEAEVTLPPSVVVIVKGLQAGAMIHAGDVALKPATVVNPNVQPFYNIEEVVGKEAALSLPAATVLGRAAVRRPIVIRRGDAVTLYARSAGLRVRTTVRAREDAAVGDLVTVESLATREPFYARATGVQEAEVYADAAEATPITASSATNAGYLGSTPGGIR